ncbi:MAG TPA: sporangiospore maturation cell wall hydrolase GsmA [Rugosimonospora sp.]|nr:sporangiospore maturation cell wall hydrolase GsmA [Rugosimonospora sp.]
MGNTWKARAVLLGLAAAGLLAATALPAAARTVAYATVTTASPLNVRGGAGTGFPRLRTVANRTRVTPTCQRTGTRVTGPAGTSNLWDQLPGGGYVADAYLRWSPSRPALPTCTTPVTSPSAPKPGGTPAPAPQLTHAQFIAAVATAAQATARQYRVPASVTLAQAILESGWGGSGLSATDHNYFGIKCFSGVYGPIAIGCHSYATHECGNGSCWATTATFRVYHSLGDSIADHGRFLVVNSRYQPAFAYRNDPDQFAVQLQLAGYATAPTYAQSLQNLMRLYNLYQYDIRIP